MPILPGTYNRLRLRTIKILAAAATLAFLVLSAMALHFASEPCPGFLQSRVYEIPRRGVRELPLVAKIASMGSYTWTVVFPELSEAKEA